MTEEAPKESPSEPPLVVDALTVRYPAHREPSLDVVSLTVAAGERVGVAGRTGAGKSTLALAAAGFIPRVVRAKLEGRVAITGVDTATAAPGALLGRVGIVFATPANQLSGSKLTVREELAFGLENLGIPRAEMDARIEATLARLSIGHLADREPYALSGGEQQRVAIASIVAMGTSVLVLDEPTAQLDPAGTAAVADLLDELARDGTTVLCAEHDPGVLGRMDRALVLEAGRTISLDVPARPWRRPRRAMEVRRRRSSDWPGQRAWTGARLRRGGDRDRIAGRQGAGRDAAPRERPTNPHRTGHRRPTAPPSGSPSMASSTATRQASKPSVGSP